MKYEVLPSEIYKVVKSRFDDNRIFAMNTKKSCDMVLRANGDGNYIL